jgi:hypothetical protein
MSSGRRIALAVWIILNAAVLALLVLSPAPLLERGACKYSELRDRTFLGLSGECSGPYIEPRELLAGAILGNGLVLAAWVATRR